MHQQAYIALKVAALGDVLQLGGVAMLKESLESAGLLPEARRAYGEALELAESICHLDADSQTRHIQTYIQGLISKPLSSGD